MKRTWTVLMCLVFLLLVTNLRVDQKNAGTNAADNQSVAANQIVAPEATNFAALTEQTTATTTPGAQQAAGNQIPQTSMEQIRFKKDVERNAVELITTAQKNTLAFTGAQETRARGVTQKTAEMSAANMADKIAKATQGEQVALTEARTTNSEIAQLTQVNFTNQTVNAQADVASGQVTPNVILPQSLANSTVATQLHFDKKVACASYLAPGVAITAQFAHWQTILTTTSVAVT